MSVVLAAVDDSSAAAPVLATARALAEARGASASAIHVEEGDGTTAAAVAGRAGVPIRLVQGEPVAELLGAADDATVELIVIGSRGLPSGPRPVGHVALEVLERSRKPVVVVPPDAAVGPEPAIRRILVPLEGSASSSEAVVDLVHEFAAAGGVVVGLHVFDRETVPRFWDEAVHSEQSYAAAFLGRWCADDAVDLHLRRGPAPDAIVDFTEEEPLDLVAVGWSRDLGGDHAAVVRALLGRCRVPVLLIPV